MQLPSRFEVGHIIDIIKTIRRIESNRDDKDKKLFLKLINNEISKKQYLKELKNNKILKSSKDIDSDVIKKIVEFNNELIDLSKKLKIPEIKKLTLKNRSIINKLVQDLGLKKSKKIEEKIKLDISKKTPEFKQPKEILPENYQVLIPGFAYMFIQEKDNKKKYIVAEPELTEEEKKIYEKTKQDLIDKISLSDLNDEVSMYKQIDKILLKNKTKLNKKQKEKIVYYIVRKINGLDEIEALMHDPLIEDIECDGVGIPIFIVHRKYGHIATNISFDSEKKIQEFIIKMAHLSKSYVSYASPLLDSILPDGSRVNATLTSNISTRGPTFTIRKFPQKPLTAIDLIKSNTINPSLVAYLWSIVEFKKTIIIVGPTAAGKTTLLNVITSFIPPAQRIVSIEDTREINLLMDNWVPQITRPGFGPPDLSGKKYGEVTMSDLLKESFRQRPDYLIIGEVRGKEIALMFQGMASGHCCISTVHSRSLNDLITRLTTPPISLSSSLITSLDVVIITGFKGKGEKEREIKEIDEISGFNTKENKIEYNAIYKSYEKIPEKREGELFTRELPIIYKSDILKDIAEKHNIRKTKLLEMINSRKKFITKLLDNPPKDYIEFKRALNKYKSTEKLPI